MRLTNKVLKNRAKPYDFDRPGHARLLGESMLEIMRRERGIGLAAPQLGISRRLFVMEIDDQKRICFNPEITEFGPDTADMAEGCLSFPGKSCIINRPTEIAVRYQNHQGDWCVERLQGLMARCFQHELDHLDGMTMQDRMKAQNATES